MRYVPTLLLIAVALWSPVFAQVNLPEGFEIVEFGFSEKQTSIPALNDCGQIVYHTGAFTQPATEVYLYDNGRIVQLTNNNVPDVLPHINDAGTIVWTQDFDGFGGGRIMMLRDGEVTELGTATAAQINRRDQVAWSHLWGQTCRAESDIYLYKRGRARLIYSDGLSNQGAAINDHQVIVWTWYDFCAVPYISDILLYSDGRVIKVSNQGRQNVDPHINNPGVVAWMLAHEIYLWENGDVRKVITGRPSGWPSLNDHGDIFFWRWYDERKTFDAWLYRVSRGEPTFHRLTDDQQWDGLGNINNLGETAWWWAVDLRQGPDGGIRFLRRVRTGDSEFDGDIDLVDSGALADCMTGPGRVDRLCDCRFLDIDHDGDVDLADFARFQNAFTGE